MATELKLRKGTTAEHSTFTGAEAEVTFDTDKNTIVAHDGATAGGIELSRADGQNANMPTSAMPAGSVIQVVSTSLDGAPTSNVGSFTQVPNFFAEITPLNVSSKIYLSATVFINGGNTGVYHLKVRRKIGSSGFQDLFSNSADVNAQDGIFSNFQALDSDQEYARVESFTRLDDPNTTQKITYAVFARTNSGGGNDFWRINRTSSLSGVDHGLSQSCITLMEVAQ